MRNFHSVLKEYSETPEAKYYATLDRRDRKIVRDTYDRIMSKNIKDMGHKSAFELAIAIAKHVVYNKVEEILAKVPPSKREAARRLAEDELNL